MQASLMSLVLALAAPAAAQSDQRYIVVFHDGVDVDAAVADLTAAHGGAADIVLRGGVSGFAGALGAGRVKAMARDARVKYVEVDGTVQTCQEGKAGKGKPGGGTTTPPPQTDPTGIRRIAADSVAGTFLFSVAVIDTGVDLTHPDLNAVSGANLVNSANPANDDNGHGSHVAGTIGALDNADGVVGVAPGIQIVAVKVLDRRGSGFTSWVVGGIDWVTTQASSIKVANMSLGGGGSSAIDDAVIASIGAGITYAVAAGNETVDASTRSPARVGAAVTVAALADYNGKEGGMSDNLKDDTFAYFSNFGSVVDIIAPGVYIDSTYKNGGYARLSGTSMATPHVAGVAALILRKGLATTPDGVAAQLKIDAKETVLGAVPTDTTRKVVNVVAGY